MDRKDPVARRGQKGIQALVVRKDLWEFKAHPECEVLKATGEVRVTKAPKVLPDFRVRKVLVALALKDQEDLRAYLVFRVLWENKAREGSAEIKVPRVQRARKAIKVPSEAEVLKGLLEYVAHKAFRDLLVRKALGDASVYKEEEARKEHRGLSEAPVPQDIKVLKEYEDRRVRWAIPAYKVLRVKSDAREVGGTRAYQGLKGK